MTALTAIPTINNLLMVLSSVTISENRLAPDLLSATIYFSLRNGAGFDQAFDAGAG